MQKRVVIVGGGFAGVKAALELAKDDRFKVTLISNRTCFEYHAALYRSVTGRSVLEVALPLSEIFARTRVEVVEDTIVKLEPSKQAVIGADGSRYTYETLILALGNVTAYFGIKGLEEYSYGMKSVNEALRLRHHLHGQLSTHKDIDEHYVVVGAGPTGVELASELQSYLTQIYRRHRIGNKRFMVDVVEAAPAVLPSVPQLSRRVERRLKQLGIHLDTNTAVEGETVDTLKLPHGTIKSHSVVWTAGVTGHPLYTQYPKIFTLGKGGRVAVDRNLKAAPGIYVLGDSAATKYSGMAQTALYDGQFVADYLRGNKYPYRPKLPIAAIPVGRKWCAVAIGRLTFYGRLGWVVRRYLDLKLYSGILPLRLALRTWLYGSKTDEACSVCRT